MESDSRDRTAAATLMAATADIEVSTATVPAAILRQAAETPTHLALSSSTEALTYQELVTRATALAAAIEPGLVDAGTPDDRLIAVLQPRGTGAVVAQLAAWLSGAAFLPIDPALPPHRIAQILTQAGCHIVVAEEDVADRLPAGVSRIGAHAHSGSYLAPTQPDHLAYVISTSGSTGRPKQVEVEHRSLLTTLSWYADFFELGPGVRTAAFAGLGFDACLLDLWAPLLGGATVVLAGEDEARDPDRIVETLVRQRIEHCFLATPFAEQVLRGNPPLHRLRSLATGGDRLRVWPPAEFGAAVHNLYGPTEATILVTATDDLRRDQDRSQPPPIGRPVAGARLALDAPATEPGELLIAGPVLARGYRGAPEETARAFTVRPGDPGRVYRTGDICRLTDGGQLSFVGRTDGQVKVRGNRVELGEVEVVLLDTPGVEQAVAVLTERDGQPVLAARVVGTASSEAVRAWLRDHLPGSMVPHSIEVLDALPLTPNGKLDRTAVEATVRADPPTTADAPTTTAVRPAELDAAAGATISRDTVADAWQAVLGTVPGPDDDFFLAGGDSLLAVRFTARVKRRLGIGLRSSMVFEHRRFADYLAAVEAARVAQSAASTDGGVGSAR
jgi:amino acid adenylation domain-containing protein